LEDCLDHHAAGAMAYERKVVQWVRRLTAEPRVEHRQEDLQEEISCVLHAPPPVPAEDKKVDFMIATPLGEVRIRVNKLERTGNIHAAVGNNVSLFGVDAAREHCKMGRIRYVSKEISAVKPNLLVELRRMGMGLIGSHQLRTQPARKQKDGPPLVADRL